MGAGLVLFVAAGVLNGFVRVVNNSKEIFRKNFACRGGVALWFNLGEWAVRGSNPRPIVCKTTALPLS